MRNATCPYGLRCGGGSEGVWRGKVGEDKGGVDGNGDDSIGSVTVVVKQVPRIVF